MSVIFSFVAIEMCVNEGFIFMELLMLDNNTWNHVNVNK